MAGEDLFQELVELRRGRGLDSPDLAARIGPGLRAACGIDASAGDVRARTAVVGRLASAVAELPDDLRLAAQAAFGIAPAPRLRFLRERMTWLADQLQRDVRTVARRCDEALRLVAESLTRVTAPELALVPGSEHAPDGWYVDSLVANVVLDRDPPQVIETRRIVAVAAGLDRISVSFSAPRGPEPVAHPLSVKVLHGGELTDVSGEQASHVRAQLRLPRPLAAGESHEYGILFSAFPRRWLRPFYVLTPLRRCNHFRLRAKFDREWAPTKLWRVDGLPTRLLDDFVPGPELLDLDGVGEVSVEFRSLRQGLSYGIQWVNPD